MTYPECPQGVVGGVCLLPAAPVHQTLQLDQEELLGSAEVRRGGRASGAGQTPGVPQIMHPASRADSLC